MHLKSLVKIAVAIILLTVMMLVMAGCQHQVGNRITSGQDVQTFNYAYVYLDGKVIKEGYVTQWRDYDESDVVQVVIEGKYYLTHYSNVVLIADPSMGSLGYDVGFSDYN